MLLARGSPWNCVTVLGLKKTRMVVEKNPILWASRPQSGKHGSNVFVRAKDAKSPRLTRLGPTRCYPGHTSGTTPLRKPGMEWVYQVWRKSQITVGLKQDSSLRVFARVEPQNDQRVYLNHQILPCSKQLYKIPTTSYTHSSHLLRHPVTT